VFVQQAEDSFEWRSLVDALRAVPVDTVRSTFAAQGVVAFTDGACARNPGGPAGWSAILLNAHDVAGGAARPEAARIECYGHIPASPATTNNRAEITAVLAAMSIAPAANPLTIFSDSEYTIKVASGVYQMKANSDLWSLYRLLLKRRSAAPAYEWVRGHAGHDLNERADELAGLGAWNGDREAYARWQESILPEARNALPAAELLALRQQVQKLKNHFDGLDPNGAAASTQERQFIDDMFKRLQKNTFSPSQKQSNWVKGMRAKYKL
jgi:ribonuclease HI